MNVSEALAEGRRRLKAGGIDRPFFEASLLLAGAGGRARLLAGAVAPISPEEAARYRERVSRRVSGVCAAYITGFKEFWGLDFAVSPAVLVPRPETETLVEAAAYGLEPVQPEVLINSALSRTGLSMPIHLTTCLENACAPVDTAWGKWSGGHLLWGGVHAALPPDGKGGRLLDLCTGSGAVAVALAHERPDLEVWAADISEAALETAKQNAARLVGEAAVRFFKGDLFAALPSPAPRFHVITANAPYIPTDLLPGLAPEVRGEPRIALDGGADGLDCIRAIVSAAPDFLVPGGVLLLEADPPQMDEISLLLAGRSFSRIQRWKDLAGNDRVIGGTLP